MVNKPGQETLPARKRRGPAPTGKGIQIGVRFQPPQLAALDAWIAQQEHKPSRAEAVRQFTIEGIAAAMSPNGDNDADTARKVLSLKL